MKKTLIILLVFASLVSLNAQDREYQTLFSTQNTRVSGLGGPFMQFTTVSGEFAFMMGGGGAVLLNDFFFGGYGLGLATTIPDYIGNNLNGTNNELVLSHGGFWIGYSFFADRAIHLSVSSLVGWGLLGTMPADSYYVNGRDNIFVLAPTVEVELNLTRYFRIGAGATYNLYSLVDLEGYSSSDISAPGGFLSFKFGWF